MNIDKLKIVSSKVVLGLLEPVALVEFAVDALECGSDSPSLRILAGLSCDNTSEIMAYFYRILSELGIALPEKYDAVMTLAQGIAKEILSGAIRPDDGAKRIWVLTLRCNNLQFPALDSFVYAASEWDERPEDRPVFEAGIIAAAEEVVNVP
ncbi:MAG: hypothetical protein AB7R40_26295 [Nitrospiraceae bacterium]